MLIYLLIFLSFLPSIVWILLDKRVWPWDPSWYGQVSVELFYTLLYSPKTWIDAMLSAFRSKAPGLAWFGQFFVPIGVAIGSIDAGLLISVLVTQFLTLILIFKSIEELSNGKKLISIAACIVVASAPLFIAMSHQYFVESLQTFVVAWFIYIASFAPKWNKNLIIFQLLAATSLAMITKITSPIYCLGFGLIATAHIIIPKSKIKSQEISSKYWGKQYTFISVVLAIIFSSSTIAWYTRNLFQILEFAAFASSGSGAELYGKRDTFINKLTYWLYATQRSFSVPGVAIIVIILCLVAFIIYCYKSRRINRFFTVCVACSLLHIFAGLTLFSLSINEETRYLLPLVPHIAIIIAWSLTVVNQKLLTNFIILLFAIQFLYIHSQALGIIPETSNISKHLYPFERNNENASNLSKIVQKSCNLESVNRYNIVGVELPWLNANSASYFAAKHLERQKIRCYYTNLGYAEIDVDKAWQRLISFKTNYFITLDSSYYENLKDAFNKVAVAIAEKIKSSNNFQPLAFPDNSKILIYKSK